ncbi:MAG: shikimate dehydrogenase [Acidimicrobiia bacterium]
MAEFWFIGVTTAGSFSKVCFPRWAEALGRPEVRLVGVDVEIHAPPDRYRSLVESLLADPEVLGGLVTTHKIDLLAACRDLFDDLGPHARLLGEVSSIAKDDGRLVGRATDPGAGGDSLDLLLGPDYFGRTGGHVLMLGAGGAAAALTSYLVSMPDRPERVTVVNRSVGRLDRLAELIAPFDTDIELEFVQNADPTENDRIMAGLPDGSVVINATGMGKDTPGSPVTDDAVFPRRGVAWDLNYRGELGFLRQAHAQHRTRELAVADGWDYFVRGWTIVMSHVLHVAIDESRAIELSRLAAEVRGTR